MKLWWILFNKEFRLMQSFLLVHAFIFLVFGTVGTYLAARYHSGVPSLLLFIAIVWHTFYLLIYMVKSLRKEKKNVPIWMHSPQSGWFLLSAKFAAGLSLLCISLIIITGLWLWMMDLDFPKGAVEWENGFPFLHTMNAIIKQHWGVLALTFALRALFLAVLVTFIYFIRDVWKYTLGGWRWILFPLLIIIAVNLMVRFSDSSVYEAIFGWGTFDLPELDVWDSSNVHHIPQSLIWGNLSWGDLVFRGLITSVLFYVSGWLFDRKVEA
jgi:uncharacterized membrane protein YfcA